MPSDWKQIIEPASSYDPHGFCERRLNTDFKHLRVGFSCDPLKDDKWVTKSAVEYGGLDNPRFRREQLIDYFAYSGQRIYPYLCKAHQEQKDVSEWTKFRVIDQGIRHPTVCLWVAVNSKGDRHVYKEYYANDRSIAMNCRAILDLSEGEQIAATFIDPATNKRSEESTTPIIDIYEDNGIPCIPADNSFAGYDNVGNAILSHLARVALRQNELPKNFKELGVTEDQLLTLANKPALTFDPRFTNRCYRECCNLRWQETKGDTTQKSPPEKPVDKDDDGPDCVRYAVQSELWHEHKSSQIKPKVINVSEYFKKKRELNSESELLENKFKRGL